ncbi:similar to Saccharomyces cerevisiae YBR173C UMP1 Short-lived chaperone required for correct maturation of the 20S proteasome [Maudiozyma saulgeensis]|uniref:Similar to Saccharomyces cerevisiae YBR173C UMP1 Short-lived chaperone required for correct maturation of the 20S proteasome n=1 Tax=Maudiozyma saulgeensis TaxID=1789683 RepID=A0A1X7R1L9_9SACH|nr:similar to Saccharomyces cerevisiae YBR173C UMP1 Short-lived chaperone required for correct maturation of the 20S proteasome [Kazachstania saulgeensis]
MNVIPGNNFNTSVSTSQDTLHQSNAIPSLPDTLRQQNGGAVPLSSQIGNHHPLQDRITNWESTQRDRQLEQYRQIFGIAEPMKRVMELEIIEKSGFNPIHNNGNSLHKDILLNKDTSIDWEDVYTTNEQITSTAVAKDIHTVMENNLNL